MMVNTRFCFAAQHSKYIRNGHRWCVLLCFVDPRVRKIRNKASSCPGIFSRTLGVQ